MPLPTALYSAAQVRALDAYAINTLAVPGYTLMKRAGEAALRYLRTRFPMAHRIVIVCGGGIVMGQLIGSSLTARRMLLPVLRSAYAVPLVVLYPVMMVWFGLESGSKIAFASIYAFIPTMLTAVAGVAALSPALGVTARAFGATRAQQILYVSLPASLPSMVAALRLGGALVIVGVIVAQMLGAADGLGYLITRHRTLLNSPGVYAGIVLVLGITGMHEILLRRLERKVAAYRQS